MGAPVYDDAFKAKAVARFTETGELRAVAREFGIHHTTLMKWIEISGAKYTAPATDRSDSAIAARLVAHAKEGGRIADAMNPYNPHVHFRIDTDKPVDLADVADEHLGFYGVDYDLFEAVNAWIMADDQRYCRKGGDLIENTPPSFPSAGTVFDQVIPPHHQERLARYHLEELAGGGDGHEWVKNLDGMWEPAGKCVLYNDGNHEARNFKRGHMTFAHSVGSLVPVCFNSVRLTLEVGDQKYEGICNHHLPGSTRLNRWNGHRRAREDAGEPIHFVMSAHLHKPAAQYWIHRGCGYADVVTGTFKKSDPFLEKQGVAFAFGVPVLRFFPDRHKIEVRMMDRTDFGL